GGRGDRISEGENDLDCAECGAQGAQCFRPQVLGQFVSTISRHKEMTCAYIKNPEMADKLQLELGSAKSPISCPRILHNRLWRFPFKPPALLGVIDLICGDDPLAAPASGVA